MDLWHVQFGASAEHSGSGNVQLVLLPVFVTATEKACPCGQDFAQEFSGGGSGILHSHRLEAKKNC
eukprot:2254263-Amphidinium_carterae.1